jgi:thiol-disulfide isomerase/thioredoxin
MLLVAAPPRAAAIQAEGADRLARLTRIVSSLDARDMDGRVWNASALRGRVTVIDFWATWCAPCLAEIPTLRGLRDTFTDRVVVLGVNLDVTDRRGLVSWMNRQRVDWPQLHDGRGYQGDLARQFEVTSLPTSVLVDPDGRVVALNLRGRRLVAAVETLLRDARHTKAHSAQPHPDRGERLTP